MPSMLIRLRIPKVYDSRNVTKVDILNAVLVFIISLLGNKINLCKEEFDKEKIIDFSSKGYESLSVINSANFLRTCSCWLAVEWEITWIRHWLS